MSFVEKLSEDELAIFLFHGVINKSSYAVRNYTNKHLEKDVFFRIIRDLKLNGNAISMDDVVEYWENGATLPPRCFAITFDDGFENNYSVAAPILKDLHVPATFYITTDFVENNSMSWIDRIECCLACVPQGSLHLPWERNEHCFQTAEEKIRILKRIREKAKLIKSIDVDWLVSDIFNQCGIDEIYSSNDQLDLKMNWEQVRRLSEEDNFIVGGHSHTHKILSFLGQDELNFEIRTNLGMLKEKAGVQVRHYSYPEGLEHCFSNVVISTLKHFNIVCCPTAIDGINNIHNSLFELKRISVT